MKGAGGEVRVFGVRHHGPGSARAVATALAEFAPGVLLVEGPPEGDAVLVHVSDPALRPPVALLVYPRDTPGQAVFYPFAVYSPEWVALRWAATSGVAARFIDLPMGSRSPGGDGFDPLGELSTAAGEVDREAWWERTVEQRRDTSGMFQGLIEAMAALREARGPSGEAEERREAHMRRCIRAALAEGHGRVAVVCGAWHAPALAGLGAVPSPFGLRRTAKEDDATLRGLPRVQTVATWIPWTHERLSAESGYGAGVRCPGWYTHLWAAPDLVATRWVTAAARLLREADLDASSSSVIDAVRLAEALAAMQGRSQPGLPELGEAILSALCGGNEVPYGVVRRRLEIAEGCGEVPPSVPEVPLARDVRLRQAQARLRTVSGAVVRKLDVRTPLDLARSLLLHQLRLVGVPWGTPEDVRRAAGTFWEAWTLEWTPELEVLLIERARYGHTLTEAAAGYVREVVATGTALPALVAILEVARLADLPEAMVLLAERVAEVSSGVVDVPTLLSAMGPLARLCRYGDVRGAPPPGVHEVFRHLLTRACVGMCYAARGLGSEPAEALMTAMGTAREATRLYGDDALSELWNLSVLGLADAGDAHEMVEGYACRILPEEGRMTSEELGRRAGLALSGTLPPERITGWLTGLLRGSGLAVLQQDAVWASLDGWLGSRRCCRCWPCCWAGHSRRQPMSDTCEPERLRRWRLVLGEAAADGLGTPNLDDTSRGMDRVLAGLYDGAGGLGRSNPQLVRWLGDIRSYFPTEVVRVLQADAVDRLGLRQLLLEPELLAAQVPDVHLVATLLSLASVLPARTRETAREVVRRVLRQVEARLREKVRGAVRGAVDRASLTRRPRAAEIDWHRTIRANLGRWEPERRRMVAESLRGHRRRGAGLRDVVLCVDQSGSMAASVVYAGIFGAAMASLRSIQTRMIVFDTAVVDLTDTLHDPVELLFATQLGGGTDLQRALAYCQSIVRRPSDTVLFLISDLGDGGDRDQTVARAARRARGPELRVYARRLPGGAGFGAAAVVTPRKKATRKEGRAGWSLWSW